MANSEFYATRDLFANYISYSTPLSYDEWLNVADDLKAAVLYCQFFDQITLAWYKLKSVYSAEADGVDEALQYLQKNVEKIKQDGKRFTPSYIYRIMYNCLYCLCRDPNRYKKVYENECSNIQMSTEGEFDLFDLYSDNASGIDAQLALMNKEKIWKVIESRGRKTAIVVAELLGEEYDWMDEHIDLPKAGEPVRMKWKSHKCKVDASTRRNLYSRSKYSEDKKGAVRISSDSQIDENNYLIEYKEYVKDSYKGVRKFRPADHESVSEEERAEIMEFLRGLFSQYKNAFAF